MKDLILIQLKLLAMKAIPEIERQGVAYWKANGEKLRGKSDLALKYIEDAYGKATANVPGLNATTINDALLKQAMVQARDWAWGKIGGVVNEASHAPDDGIQMNPWPKQ